MTLIPYLEQVLTVVLIGALAWLLARWVIRSAEVWRTAALLYVGLLYAVDPYSWGGRGGDVGFESHPWQMFATASAVALIIVALASADAPRRRYSSMAVGVELVVFLGLNAVYVARDGLEARFLAGYNSSAVPLIAVATGFLVRLAILFRSTTRPMHGGAARPG